MGFVMTNFSLDLERRMRPYEEATGVKRSSTKRLTYVTEDSLLDKLITY